MSAGCDIPKWDNLRGKTRAETAPEMNVTDPVRWCPRCRTEVGDPGANSVSAYAAFWRDNACGRCGSQLTRLTDDGMPKSTVDFDGPVVSKTGRQPEEGKRIVGSVGERDRGPQLPPASPAVKEDVLEPEKTTTRRDRGQGATPMEVVRAYGHALVTRRISVGREADLPFPKEIIRKALIDALLLGSQPNQEALLGSYFELESFLPDAEFAIAARYEHELAATLPLGELSSDADFRRAAAIPSELVNAYQALQVAIAERTSLRGAEFEALLAGRTETRTLGVGGDRGNQPSQPERQEGPRLQGGDASSARVWRKKLGCAAYVVFFGIGFTQWAAIVNGIQTWLGVPRVIAILGSLIIAYIPIVGTIAGIKGAMTGWGWELWPSLILFCGPYTLYLGAVAAAFGADRTRSKPPDGAAGLLSYKRMSRWLMRK